MCVWTKKRGSMKAAVLMATPCPKSLHGKRKGEKWIARNICRAWTDGLATADDFLILLMFITIYAGD